MISSSSQDAVVARVRLWQDAPSWSEELVKALALEDALVQPALALTRKVHDAVLTDKVMVLANILALARDAAAVAAVLAKATDAEKPCSLENVALLSTLRKHIGMMKYCVDEGELSRFDEETRLALPFKMAVVVQNVIADANTIATTLTSEWIANAAALISRLHELTPPHGSHTQTNC